MITISVEGSRCPFARTGVFCGCGSGEVGVANLLSTFGVQLNDEPRHDNQ